jgi:hypothetical protein
MSMHTAAVRLAGLLRPEVPWERFMPNRHTRVFRREGTVSSHVRVKGTVIVGF